MIGAKNKTINIIERKGIQYWQMGEGIFQSDDVQILQMALWPDTAGMERHTADVIRDAAIDRRNKLNSMGFAIFWEHSKPSLIIIHKDQGSLLASWCFIRSDVPEMLDVAGVYAPDCRKNIMEKWAMVLPEELEEKL